MRHFQESQFGLAKWPKVKNINKYVCKRSGLLSFEKSTFDTWESAPLGAESANYSRFIPPYSKSLDCIRVFFKDVGGSGCHPGYRIPQMFMYVPESGYPLCESAKIRAYKMSGSWPSKYRRFFVTIPVPHIYRGLYGVESADHQLTVFNVEMPPFSAADVTSSNQPDRKKYGRVGSLHRPFITDRNACNALETPGIIPEPLAPEGQDTVNWFNSWIYKNWGAEMSMEERMAARDYAVGSPLSTEHFEDYLPYWMLLYPNKFILSKSQPYGSTGTDPGEVEACQGYLRYTPSTYSEDFFYGGNRAFARLYNLQEPSPLFGDKTNYAPVSGAPNYISYSDSTGQGFYANYARYVWFGQRSLMHMAIIRAYLDYTGTSAFNTFPFKAPRYSKRGALQKVSEKVAKTLSDIMRYRSILDKGSKLIAAEDTFCKKCGEELRIPQMLAVQKPDLEKLVCYPCGAKYLANLAYLLTDASQKWFYYDEYPVQEVFPLVGMQ